MATTSITFRTDEEFKRKAVQIFTELGMDLSTGMNVLLHALVRENGFPFPVAIAPDAEYRAWMKQELQKSWERQSDPEAQWYTTEEIRARFGV